jgi:tetratricopeptide (TPR) repeat protein
MKIKFLHFLILIFLWVAVKKSPAQNLDSLWEIYHNKNHHDTTRLKAIHTIAWSYNSDNPDSSILLAQHELKLAQLVLTIHGRKWVARAYNTIGSAYDTKSNYPKAFEYYLLSLKIWEEIGDKKGIGNCYNNIGIVYKEQGNNKEALKYYLKAQQICEETNNKRGVAACYINVGEIYRNQSEGLKALEYFKKALKIYEETGNNMGVGTCYNNIGNVYIEQANYPKALECYLKALHIREEIGDDQGKGSCQINIGEVYLRLGNYPLALKYSDTALQISRKIGDIDVERLAYINLATTYSKLNRYKEAYENHVKFKALTDSIFNADNSIQLGDLRTKFEVEKKEAELKIKSDAEQEKLKAIAGEEKKIQRVVLSSVAGVLLLVIVFSLFLYKRFKVTQRQKHVIEEQKVLVDRAYDELHEKNKQVMDSIRYAKRIQTALITSEKHIENSLNRLMKNN